LGRFGGNIYCFKRLSDDVLLSIAKKDISRINLLIKDQNIEIEMQDLELSKLIKSKYLPREGARSILGYIDRNITSGIADLVLGETSFSGKIRVLFDPDQDQAILVANNTIPSREQ
jgi:ATP-dependent Clp protease ATP-binding subunit ClpA